MALNEEDIHGYKDRIEAGFLLAKQLKQYAFQTGVVLAIPRGGIPVGYVVAEKLGFDLDILLTKKIGHPSHKEYAIGAVSMTERILVPHEGVSNQYIEEETRRIREKLFQMYQEFNGDREPVKIKGKITILVDDGIATGNTMSTIINMVKNQSPSKLIMAVPVASGSAIEILSQEIDEIICPLIPESFTGVGAFYIDFDQVSNEEVKAYLENFRQNFS